MVNNWYSALFSEMKEKSFFRPGKKKFESIQKKKKIHSALCFDYSWIWFDRTIISFWLISMKWYEWGEKKKCVNKNKKRRHFLKKKIQSVMWIIFGFSSFHVHYYCWKFLFRRKKKICFSFDRRPSHRLWP